MGMPITGVGGASGIAGANGGATPPAPVDVKQEIKVEQRHDYGLHKGHGHRHHHEMEQRSEVKGVSQLDPNVQAGGPAAASDGAALLSQLQSIVSTLTSLLGQISGGSVAGASGGGGTPVQDVKAPDSVGGAAGSGKTEEVHQHGSCGMDDAKAAVGGATGGGAVDAVKGTAGLEGILNVLSELLQKLAALIASMMPSPVQQSPVQQDMPKGDVGGANGKDPKKTDSGDATPPTDTKPPTDTTPPTESTPPAGGSTPPAGGSTPPAGGSTPPASESTPPAGVTPPPAPAGAPAVA